MCASCQLKRTTFTFLAQICLKRKLGFGIHKTNVGIRISILEISYVCQLSVNTVNFDFFDPNLPKKEFKVGNS